MTGTEKIVFMFSGQGSHYLQMGRSFFDGNLVFRKSMLRLDELARELTGASVLETLYAETHAPGMPFDRTRVTHPAIFMVEYSLSQALIAAGVIPDVVLGTSLGSFVSAVLAQFISLEDALTAVARQAVALEENCEPGGMIAILGSPQLYDEDFLRSACDCAAVNFPAHFVVSAPAAHCMSIQNRLAELNVPWQRLEVSHAFHSRWMDRARGHFEAFTKTVRIGTGSVPLICCDRAVALTAISPGHFWDVTRHPIRFPKAIANLERTGSYRYVDVGPSGTLATFLKYILPADSRSTVHPILTPYGRDSQNWAALTTP